MKKLFTILTVCLVCVALNAQTTTPALNFERLPGGHFTEVNMDKGNFASPASTTLSPGAFTLPCGTGENPYFFYREVLSIEGTQVDVLMSGTNLFTTTYGHVFRGCSGTISDIEAVMALVRGGSGSVRAELYTLGADGFPNTLLGTSQPILANTMQPQVTEKVTFHFNSPVTVPWEFVVVIVLPTVESTSTAMLALATSTEGCYIPGTESYPIQYGMSLRSAEKAWITLQNLWESPVGLFDLAIFPNMATVGVNENTQVEFSIFPNPARESFNIAAQSEIKQVEVYNQIGQLIYTENVAASNCNINTSDFVAGMYFVKVISAEGNSVKKLNITK